MKNCNYNWEKLGKVVWLRKVCVRSLWRHTSKLRLSLYLAPCRQFALLLLIWAAAV